MKCHKYFQMCSFEAFLSKHFFVVTDEVDEIEVYGSEAQSGTQLATYSFEVGIHRNYYYYYSDILLLIIPLLGVSPPRCVIAYSTLDLVQMPPWVNLPFYQKRYLHNMSL